MGDEAQSLVDQTEGLTLQDTDPYIRTDGVAAIKKEFLLDEPHAEEPVENVKKEKKEKKAKGMNKDRLKEMARMTTNVRAASARLCPSVYMPNVKCKHGEKCTSEHDIGTFLARKEADLGDVCPVYEQRGHCPFSYACRYGNAHLTEDGKQAQKEPAKPYVETRNAKNMHIQMAMRKRKYDFSRSIQFLETLPDCYHKRKGARASAPKAKDFVANDSENKPVAPAEEDEQDVADQEPEQKVGSMEREKRRITMKELAGKKYVAPLTTVGNLPFRRICVDLGADVTCSEMALATSILGGVPSEFSLVKRHASEKIFGVQLAGGFADTMAMTAQIIVDEFDVDFIDINMGCPIDVVNQKGGGCSLPTRPTKLYDVMRGMRSVMKDVPLTIKLRTGMKEGVLTADETLAGLIAAGCTPDLVTFHPRSKEQRYSKLAKWEFVEPCVKAVPDVPFWVCGDVLSWEDYYQRLENNPIDGVMIGRGILIKPWLLTEIDERRHWDITATERLDIIKNFVWYGLDHWGSDSAGVEKTRRFLLEWLSFACRYIPVGLLEHPPQHINQRPPYYKGRNELETLLSSPRASDWVAITEMFLGPCPEGFDFIPKHKASAY
ncbi:unnamed protein product, partial [Mesorhabditis spiculigera]